MKLDLNKEVIGLNGEPLKDPKGESAIMGKILATQLAESTEGDAIKKYDQAIRLFRGEVLEVDKADLNAIKTFIEKSEMAIIVKGPLLNEINEVLLKK